MFLTTLPVYESEQSCILLVPKSFLTINIDSLVVRTLRRIPDWPTFYSRWQYSNKFESEQSCILLVPKTFLTIGADNLVVKTLRCGRSNPDSHPSEGNIFFSVAVYLNELIDYVMTLLFARYGYIWYQNDCNSIPYPMAEMKLKNICIYI